MYALNRIAVLLAALEDTYGAEQAVSPTNDAIEIMDPDIKPSYEFVRNESVNPSLTKRPAMVADGTVTIQFKTFLKGSGDITVKPRVARLLEACGMSYSFVDLNNDNINDTHLIKPHSDVNAQKSITLHLYKAGKLYRVIGAKGTFTINAEVSRYPIISFTFTGKLAADPISANAPDIQLEASRPAIFKAVTARMTKGSTTDDLKATKFELDIGNKVSPLKSIIADDGIDSIFITERDPKGSIDPIAESDSEFFTTFKNADVVNLFTSYGSGQGNVVEIEAQAQFTGIDIGEREGFNTYELPFECVSESPDEEVIIRFK